ncbi:hypothetical protein [Streptomyces sp. LN245]|uniref:hypothetical protein n=1 Tax=Streptomyces sp. LN245 TaxID=3112975 RepID=UPI00371F9363
MAHRAVVRREDLEGVQAVGVVAGGADVGRQRGLAVRRGGAQAPVRAAHREDAGDEGDIGVRADVPVEHRGHLQDDVLGEQGAQPAVRPPPARRASTP